MRIRRFLRSLLFEKGPCLSWVGYEVGVAAGATRRGRRGQPSQLWLAVASLVFQIFPAALGKLLAVADVRNWSWAVWVGVEVAVIAILLALRVRQAADA